MYKICECACTHSFNLNNSFDECHPPRNPGPVLSAAIAIFTFKLHIIIIIIQNFHKVALNVIPLCVTFVIGGLFKNVCAHGLMQFMFN